MSILLLTLLLAAAAAAQTTPLTPALVGGRYLNAGRDGQSFALTDAPDGSLLLLSHDVEFVPSGPFGDGPGALRDITVISRFLADADESVFERRLAGLEGQALAADAEGNVYVAGRLSSGEIEATSNAAFPAEATGGFLVKLDGETGETLYATPLPGEARAIAVSAGGVVYLTGRYSPNDGMGEFIATNGAPRRQPTGLVCLDASFDPRVCPDAFVIRIGAAGGLELSTLLGADGIEWGEAIAATSSGGAVIAGVTRSSDFPSGAAQGRDGDADVFVVRVSATGVTEAGGRLVDTGDAAPRDLVVGADGTAVVVGWTEGPDLPVSEDAIQEVFGGERDGFVASFDVTGEVSYASYFGGADADGLTSVALRDGAAVVAGAGEAPAALGLGLRPPCAGAGLVAALDLETGQPRWARRVGAAGDLWVSGGEGLHVAGSPDPRLLGASRFVDQRTYVARVDLSVESAPEAFCLGNGASYRSGGEHACAGARQAVAPGELVSLFGRGLGPSDGTVFALDEGGRVPSELGDVRLLFDGEPAPLLYAQGRQVNGVVPFTLEEGRPLEECPTVELTVEVAGEPVGSYPLAVTQVIPAFFTADATGVGQAAALNQDGTANGPDNPARRGEAIVLYATGFGHLAERPLDGSVTPLDPPYAGIEASIDAYVESTDPELQGAAGMDVLYAGPAPGLVSGVVQINVRIPEQARVGPASLVVFAVGEGFESTQRDYTGARETGVTIAVE